ncbi:MAG: FeoB-associated Cys-rich membrane protein [Angelakisella sp.]|jgi:hypothetical protein|nr:FeoB-associated Cys-rich membrane protein [Angelakisella sp.]
MNLSTVLIALVVLAVFVAIVASGIRKRKRGGGCSCGCSGCPSARVCHGEKGAGGG